MAPPAPAAASSAARIHHSQRRRTDRRKAQRGRRSPGRTPGPGGSHSCFGWVGVVIVIAVAGILLNARRDDSGQITSGGNLEVSDLRVGDCFDFKDPKAKEIAEVQAEPCTTPHGYELMHTFDMPGDAYPTDDEWQAQVGAECLPAFAAYVGLDFNSSVLDLAPLTPTEELWESGDHSVQCVIYDPNDAELPGSLRNAVR